jgi:hypothetical protein
MNMNLIMPIMLGRKRIKPINNRLSHWFGESGPLKI